MAYVVIGQVKRSREFSHDKAAGIIDRILDSSREDLLLSHLLVVISGHGRTTDKYREYLTKKAQERLPGVPTTVIDARDFVSCWQAQPENVLASLTRALPPAKFSIVSKCLRASTIGSEDAGWRVEADKPVGTRVRGSVLEMRVIVSAPFKLPSHTIGVAWRPGSGIDVVRPLAALVDEQVRGFVTAVLDDSGSTTLVLRFQANALGSVSIGQLELVAGAGWRSGSSRPVPAFPLGVVEIAEGFELKDIVYVPEPHAQATPKLDAAVARTLAGGVNILALVGPGGVGKTRFVDELLDRLHFAPAAHSDPSARPSKLSFTLQLEHDTERSGSRRFLLNFVCALMRPRAAAMAGEGDVALGIRQWLSRFTPISPAMEVAIAGLIEGTHAANSGPIAQLLTMAILARVRHEPVFIHLANLHWADNFEISALAELIDRLQQGADSLPHGCLIVLEGRTGEMLDGLEGVRTTDVWNELCASQHVTRISLAAWSEADSRRYLRQVLRVLGATKREPVHTDQSASLACWRTIEKHVLTVSEGNPLQLVEHVRLLLESGTLRCDASGGLTITQCPPPIENVAKSLLELVLARVEYIRRQHGNGELVALLKVLAEIGLTVEQDMFEAVTSALSDARIVERIEALQVAHAPTVITPSFRFVHETYRVAFRRAGWVGEGRAALRQAALTRLGAPGQLPPHRLISWARLMRLEPACEIGQVRDALTNGLERAELAFDFDGVADLCRELLMLPEHLLTGRNSMLAVRKTLATALMNSGNWETALIVLNSILPEVRAQEHTVEGLLLSAEIAEHLGNILGDQLRCAEGIAAVTAGLTALESAGETNAEERWHIRREQLLNRLGVLHWFSGAPAHGIKWQWLAWCSARRMDPEGLRTAHALCEVGSALLHRYPHRGRLMLARSVNLIKRQSGLIAPMFDYVRAQYLIGRLLDPSGPELLRNIDQEALAIARGEGQPPSVYGACIAWLVAAAVAFIEQRFEEAEDRFTEALLMATRCQQLRTTWKAHLGLAAVLHRRGKNAAAEVYARQAGDILLSSFDSMGTLVTWSAMVRLPLAHVRRLVTSPYEPLDELLRRVDGDKTPRWVTDWRSRPRAVARAGEGFQVLHVRSDDYDLFLLG